VANTHTEPAGYNLTLPGTATSPVHLISGTPAGTSGITAKTPGARLAASTASTLNGHYYAYGITFAFTGGVINYFGSADYHNIFYDTCIFTREGSVLNCSVNYGSRSSVLRFRNCVQRWGHADHRWALSGLVYIDGGSIMSGSATPTFLFMPNRSGAGAMIEVNGHDFSNLANTFGLADDYGSFIGWIRIRNCKMPTGWAPSFATFNVGTKVDLLNWGDGDVNYKFFSNTVQGTVKDETTIKRVGGASDGVTGYSMRMTTSANTSYPNSPLLSMPIVRKVSVGGSFTATVEIVYDANAPGISDADIWLELEYLGVNGFPQALHVSTMKPWEEATETLTSSAESWDGDTGTGPNGTTTWHVQKLVVTFSPAEDGYVVATVFLTKPSWTVFVDPKLTVV